MDVSKPEKVEQPEQEIRQAAESADAKLRQVERTQPGSGSPSDASFTDKAGRPITVRTWESGKQAYVRAYDTGKVQPPEEINIGQAGYANATLEQNPAGEARVRLNDIMTSPEYRGSGVGSGMLSQVEGFASRNNATEIYGSIDSQPAQDFWKGQADKGWTVDASKGFYGEVHKKV